uniref:Myoglobin n=1 Tax=Erpetoichthys calabaricus TaxID=27687 RepID=A0A8C4SWQ8_ERPCA
LAVWYVLVLLDCVTVFSFWAPVDADPRCYGEIILLCLFDTHPDVQKLFPKFAGLPKEQLQNNPNLQAYGEIVVCKLTEILKVKGEHKEPMKALAESHAKQHKIPLCLKYLLEFLIFLREHFCAQFFSTFKNTPLTFFVVFLSFQLHS